MSRTIRVKRKSAGLGESHHDWQVQVSGRFIKSLPKKGQAADFARVRANKGDTLIVERRDGSVQKEVEISTSNEHRLDKYGSS